MKWLVVLCAVVVVAYAQEKYTDKYDNMNVDEILNNERLLNGYASCLLDKGPCTPEGTELKAHMIEAIETGCAKCTEKQEKTAAKIIKKLATEHLDIWKEFTAKYDPTGKWQNEYRERAKENGFELP